MARYIDADVLKWRYIPLTIQPEEFVTKSDVENAPTADVVEVVRCKDCRWGREACGNIECNADLNVPPEYHGYDWFCPNGERKEDGTKQD